MRKVSKERRGRREGEEGLLAIVRPLEDLAFYGGRRRA